MYREAPIQVRKQILKQSRQGFLVRLAICRILGGFGFGFSLRIRKNLSLTDNVTNSSFGRISVVCGLIWLFFYGFVTQNLLRKPFMNVRGVKKLSFCCPVVDHVLILILTILSLNLYFFQNGMFDYVEFTRILKHGAKEQFHSVLNSFKQCSYCIFIGYVCSSRLLQCD